MLSGTLILQGYIENSSPFSIGAGKAVFANFALKETEESGGIYTLQQDFPTVNGSMNPFISQAP